MAERVGLDPASPWYAEHRSRYRFASAYVRGNIVLDAASGEGYGLAILQAAGGLPIGLDLYVPGCVPALASAFVRGDCLSLPVKTGSVDVVTSFETVEHLESDTQFVHELRRVLRPDGLLILSTPNALHTKPVNGVPANPYHVREYSPSDLLELLRPVFPHVDLLGQRTSRSYGYCPYWDSREVAPTALKLRVRGGLWKLGARFPRPFRDASWRKVFRQPFYPSEIDFEFLSTEVDVGHVLVALCRP